MMLCTYVKIEASYQTRRSVFPLNIQTDRQTLAYNVDQDQTALKFYQTGP